MRCDQCKHWSTKESVENLQDRSGLRKCNAIRYNGDIERNAVSHLNEIDYGNPKSIRRHEIVKAKAVKREKAYVTDGDNYTASFHSGPDFFCAKFESK